MSNSIQMTPPADSKVLQHGHARPRLPESVVFQTRDGKKHELSTVRLEQWFATLHDKRQEQKKDQFLEEPLHDQLLGRYGLKTPHDVIAFLKSKNGEAVLKAINEELAEIASIQEQQFIEERDHQTRRLRAMAWLFLGLLHKRRAHAQHLNQFIQEQIDKRLHKKDSSEDAVSLRNELLDDYLRTYSESSKALDMKLQSRQAEKALIDAELHTLQKQWDSILDRQAVLTASVDELEQFSRHLSELAVTPDRHEDAINLKINEISTSLSMLDAEINDRISNNRHSEASHLMQRHSAHLLHNEGLQDMLLVARGERRLFNLDGEETRSMHDAHFILTPSQKIAKDGAGKFYLIGINEDLNQMDEAQKSKALNRFNKKQTEILTVPRLVHHHCRLEKELHRQREHNAHLHSKSLQDDINLLANQRRHLESAKAAITAELTKPAPDMERAVGLGNAIPKLSNNGHAFAYGSFGHDASIQGMRQTLNNRQRNPNQAQITAFSGGMANLFSKIGQDVPKHVLQDMNRIKPGQPVPLRIMMNLNAQLFKLEFASIKAKMEPKVAPIAPAPVSTAPTPFGTWPPKPGK